MVKCFSRYANIAIYIEKELEMAKKFVKKPYFCTKIL